MTTFMIFVDSEKASRTLPLSLDVEESAKLGCVVVFNRKLNRKLYFKEGRKTKDGTELIPLSKEELKAINVEESANDVLFDISVEESEQDYENERQQIIDDSSLSDMEKGKKLITLKEKYRVNMNNLESVKQGKEILAEREAQLEGKPSREELESELEDKRAKLEIVAEKELEKRMNQLGIPEHERNFFRENPESLKAYEMAKKYSLPSPNAPLNEQQFQTVSGSERGFESYEQMVAFLKSAEKSGDATAHEILNQLMHKSILGVRKSPLDKEPESQPSLREITRKKRRSE